MADAIKFQLNIAGGALNLAYNEVVKTQYIGNIYASTINELDWSILIFTDPAYLNSWCVFRDTWDNNDDMNMESSRDEYYDSIAVPGLTVNSSNLTVSNMLYYRYNIRYANSVYIFGLNLSNGLLILAK